MPKNNEQQKEILRLAKVIADTSTPQEIEDNIMALRKKMIESPDDTEKNGIAISLQPYILARKTQQQPRP